MRNHSGPITIIDAIAPITFDRILRDAALIFAFVVITSGFARISIPLPFTPVPITGQTFSVLLTGAVLGSRRGAISMSIYVIAGAWLPIYADGASGILWNMATGGYLLGFVPAAFIVGYLSERGWDRGPKIILAMVLGNAFIYIPGLMQLSLFVPEGNTLSLGLYPYIPGDIIKLSLVSLILPSSWKILNLRKGS
ncbi:MAG: biotin transporter BioY [Dehalococcoidia bacterium]|nr:biotin transporter BioY [Dehalococcoidia bacterium]